MTINLIKSRLTEHLSPETLELVDNSQAHAGHAGAQSGGGHYHVRIVSNKFAEKSLLQRHQLVYKALDELMKHDIHALSIDALTPEET